MNKYKNNKGTKKNSRDKNKNKSGGQKDDETQENKLDGIQRKKIYKLKQYEPIFDVEISVQDMVDNNMLGFIHWNFMGKKNSLEKHNQKYKFIHELIPITFTKKFNTQHTNEHKKQVENIHKFISDEDNLFINLLNSKKIKILIPKKYYKYYSAFNILKNYDRKKSLVMYVTTRKEIKNLYDNLYDTCNTLAKLWLEDLKDGNNKQKKINLLNSLENKNNKFNEKIKKLHPNISEVKLLYYNVAYRDLINYYMILTHNTIDKYERPARYKKDDLQLLNEEIKNILYDVPPEP